jgi:hypothetical protein
MLRFKVSLVVIVRVKLVDLVDGLVIVWDLLNSLLGWHFIVLVVELNEVRIALLDLSNIDFLLISILRLLMKVRVHFRH